MKRPTAVGAKTNSDSEALPFVCLCGDYDGDRLAPEVLEQAARTCARVLRRERERALELLRTRSRWLDEPELLGVVGCLDRLIGRADELVRQARELRFRERARRSAMP